MQSPNAVSNGTGIFIGTFAVIILWAWALSRGERSIISKDSFQYVYCHIRFFVSLYILIE